jgi:hypothetical protein
VVGCPRHSVFRRVRALELYASTVPVRPGRLPRRVGGVDTFGGETWSKLRVTFPPDEPTHCRTQMYYLDAEHLIRRLDYVAEPIGRWARAAHFCAGYREWRGLRVPTNRWVVPRTRNDRVWSWPPLVRIRITAVRPISNALIADGSSHTHPSEAPRSL